MGKEEREWYHWRGLTDETINKYELGYGPPPGSKVGRFSIPVYESGRLVNVRFRRDDRCPECASRATKEIDKEHFSCDYCEHQWQVHPSKYMGIAQHNDARLYNAECLKGARRVFICEGEIDALSLVQRGYSAVSSTSGAGTFLLSWTVHFLHAALLYLCYDSDEPGRKGAEAIREAIPKARIISMPEKDINKYFLSHSTEEFEQLVREADRNPENEMKLRVATLNGSLIGETY
jgi:DNA primase